MATTVADAWVRIKDPQSNTMFYANPATGECLLEKPRNLQLYPILGDEWWELWDDFHQLPYYYHTVSGQTDWAVPSTGTIIPLRKIQNSSIGKRLSAVFAQDDNFDIIKAATGNISKQIRASGSLLIPNGNNQQRLATASIKVSHHKSEEFTVVTSDFPSSSSRDVDSISDSNRITLNDSENAKDFSQNSSDNSSNSESDVDVLTQKQSKRNNSLSTKFSKSRTTSFDSTYVASTSTSRPVTLSSINTNNNESDVHVHHVNQQQPFMAVSPKKSFLAADKARKSGISNPVVNIDAAAAMKPTGSLYQDLRRKKPAYQVHTRKLSTGEVMTLPPELQKDINQFKIDGFARKYFNTHKKGIFRKKVPVEKMLLFQKDLINQSLMVLNSNVQKDAIKCFKVIQRIMGDRSKGRNGPANVLEDIQWLLDRGILHGELRDEIYVQICKQLNDNPNVESIRKGWELLSVITVTFPPSKNLEAYLMQYIVDHFSKTENQVDILSKHVHNRLLRICKRGPRGKVLTLAEIERAKEAPFSPSVFGENLGFIMKLQEQAFPQLKIPRILPFLAHAILKLNGQSSEGIFRVPGDADYVTELKLRIEKNRYDMSGINDPNVPSSLLKFWLRDLAEPLIPDIFYDKCIKFSEDKNAAVDIVKELPLINQRVVAFTINFLQKFADPKMIRMTKMNIHNLAMVFAPNFLRCPSDNLAVIFENTKYEQAFLRTLLINLN
ncbi:2081_t:CDS:10, partial [Funneliformis geosporum]